MSIKPELIDFSKKLNRTVELNAPPLEELVPIIVDGLKEHFKESTVEIVKCPDLTKKPFGFTGFGIASDLRVAEVGGQGNLFPILRREKYFNLKTICKVCEMPENCFVFGPGAANREGAGTNCEMVADAVFSKDGDKVRTHISKMDGNHFKQLETNDMRCGPLANLAICSNKESASPVLKITAKQRLGQLNFPETIRQTLGRHYGAKLVSVCGVFLMRTGKALVHVMPDFPENNFHNRDELQNEWLQYFEVNAPLICASVFHSTDPALDLRLEHSHAFSEHKDSGHYHYDTTPEEVVYEGYFRPATKLYRIDKVNINGKEEDSEDSVFCI
ncbi:Ester hydrolase C11orf54-like protein [Aphelenchoides besseyi]|nr:Ester hydrolase C11orf54-like protein [Aphelenchoides besseyi]KAI6202333.1 Ester hydrolase C11orf54-like protein [Aphelenchoides besseyi]